MKNLFKILIVVVPTVLAVGYFFLQWPYTTSCYVTNKFVINENFDVVRKTLIRTPAKYKILEANGAIVVDQNWDNVSLGYDHIIHPNWTIDASAVVKLNIKNPYWGQKMMTVKQIINITPDRMLITIVLLEPVDELKMYKMVLNLARSGDHTVVDSKMTVGITVKVPCLQSVRNRVDDELNKSMTTGILSNQRAIVSSVEKYKGKNYLDLTRKLNKRSDNVKSKKS